MSQRLIFPDAESAADALTFASRTSRLGDGGVRLQAANGTLAMTSAPLAPRGLLDSTPTVLALRALPVDAELVCDLVVEAQVLVAASDDDRAIVLPEVAISPSWAGVAPPRGGWEAVGTIPAAVLAARAQYGIAAVAEAMPADPGEDVVRTVRASVWGAPDEQLEGLPLGAAFAAFALGFIAGEEDARLLTAGPWSRLTLTRGHILVRGPQRMGLGPVRATGNVQ
jgi:hypothetical protein